MKILVVDDETDVQTLFQQRFRKEIRSGEIQFAFAFSGESALDYLQKNEHEAVATGINSGEVVSGNIGSANLRRLDYTSIGDVVNTAQRLQSAARAGQIVISEDTYEKIKNSFQCGRLGEVNLKNKKEKAVIYEVIL